MILTLSVEVHSLKFTFPIFLGQDQPQWLEPQTTEEAEQDKSFALALNEAWWHALRSFFGKHQLPPMDLMDAFLKENTTQVLADWETWRAPFLSEDEPQTFFAPGTYDLHPCYIEVGHKDHYDQLSFGIGRADLLFRHPYADGQDDQEMVHAFFLPLLEGLYNAQLALDRIQMQFTFVDEQGLHRTSLVTALEKLGLL